MDYKDYQKEVYAFTQKLVQTGLIRISSGNVSVRTADGNVAITPSSIPYDELDYSQIVIVDMEGNTVEGKLKPSVEKMLHVGAYKARSEVNAVIHAHSIYGITLANVNETIPAISMEMVNLGAPIPTVPYDLPGSIAFADKMAAYFSSHPEKKAALLESHGSIVVGSSLKDAFQNAYNLETGASIYFNTLLLGRKFRVFSSDDIAELHHSYAPAKK